MVAQIELHEPSAEGPRVETIGARLVQVEQHRAVSELEFQGELAFPQGRIVQNGALLALADSTAAVAGLTAVNPSGNSPAALPPIGSFSRRLPAGKVTAESRVVMKGLTSMVVETAVRDAAGDLVVVVTTTYALQPDGGVCQSGVSARWPE